MTHIEYVKLYKNAVPNDRARLEVALKAALETASTKALAAMPRTMAGYNGRVQYLYQPLWVSYGLVQCWYEYRCRGSEGFHWGTKSFLGVETSPGVWEALVEGRHHVRWTWDLAVPNPQEVLGRTPEVYSDGPSI